MMRNLLACAIALCWLTEVASAQTFRGGIQGTVIDQGGAAVPGATVTVTSPNTGLSRTVQTDQNGNYFFSELPIGQYDVAASLQGFATETQRHVDVGASASVRVDFELRPGGVQEAVEVVARLPLVNTTRNGWRPEIVGNFCAPGVSDPTRGTARFDPQLYPQRRPSCA